MKVVKLQFVGKFKKLGLFDILTHINASGFHWGNYITQCNVSLLF